MTTLPRIFELNNYQRVNNIIIVGCGGTGAYIVAHLSRFISVLKEEKAQDIMLTLADGDSVEIKNLKRQHFVKSDVSKNKALALAERYSGAFGIEINIIPKDIETLDDLDVFDKFGSSSWSNLIIGCVDNNASRKVINSWFLRDDRKSKFWIDSGNEDRAGQVICGYSQSSTNNYTLKINPLRANSTLVGEFSLPSVAEKYPEILEDSKFNSQLSCADRAISAPQNIQTNITAATLALNYIQKIILGTSLKSFGVEFSIDNSFTTLFNIEENLKLVKDDRKYYWEKTNVY